MAVGADIVKEDDYLSTQKQEKKDDVCETTNESLPDSVLRQSVNTVDESQELIAVLDKSQEEPDDIVGEPRPKVDFLSHMVLALQERPLCRLLHCLLVGAWHVRGAVSELRRVPCVALVSNPSSTQATIRLCVFGHSYLLLVRCCLCCDVGCKHGLVV
ncbi:hypothetical protein L7F22_038653 [Adiantum nelumboides]|nr:hypothetical protein [Adiantum nelumboides]